MAKLIAALAVFTALTGCTLYFDEPRDDQRAPSSGGPDGSDTCKTNDQCAAGCYCANGVCTEAGFCTTDSDCGSGYVCDTTRSSCEPGAPAPSCAGTVTCTTAAPTCASGQVPTIANGCYTGSCEAIASCDAPPPCANINDETDCAARADCTAEYTGMDCTNPDGTACQSGDTTCTCQSYTFSACTAP